MSRWTYREYRMRLAWLNDQWNKPDRSDHYLMQIAQEVRRQRFKTIQGIRSVQIRHFHLPFKSTEPSSAKTQESLPASSRSPSTLQPSSQQNELPLVNRMWMQRVGLKVT